MAYAVDSSKPDLGKLRKEFFEQTLPRNALIGAIHKELTTDNRKSTILESSLIQLAQEFGDDVESMVVVTTALTELAGKVYKGAVAQTETSPTVRAVAGISKVYNIVQAILTDETVSSRMKNHVITKSETLATFDLVDENSPEISALTKRQISESQRDLAAILIDAAVELHDAELLKRAQAIYVKKDEEIGRSMSPDTFVQQSRPSKNGGPAPTGSVA